MSIRTQNLEHRVVPAERRPAVRWVLATLSLAMLLPALGTSIANVALPTLARGFSIAFQEVQWVVLAYLLAVTTLSVGAGKLGDLLGRRRLLLIGITLFTGASLACGVAPSLMGLVAARAVQGLGAAIMMALSLAFVGETVPKERTGSAMGWLGTMSAAGTAVGPALGGMVVGIFGWRAVFLSLAPLGVVAWFMARRYLPMAPSSSPSGARKSFDAVGTLLLALPLAAYALALTVGRGAFGMRNLLLLFLAVAGFGAFAFHEARVASPLVRLAQFRDRELRTSLILSLLVAAVVMATLVVGPFYLSRSLGLDASRVGWVLAVGPLVAALTGVPAGGWVDRWGASRMTLVGLAGMAVGSAALSLLSPGLGLFGYVIPIAVLTAHYALFQTANNTAVLATVPADQRGVIGGLLNLSRNLGLITGTSCLGAVFAFGTGTPEFATAPGSAVAAGMQLTFAVATLLVGAAFALASADFGLRTGRSPVPEGCP